MKIASMEADLMPCRLLHGIAVIVVTALFAACVTEADRDAFRSSETGLEAARSVAEVTCSTAGACAEAWQRARLFVQLRSPTPIARITDDAIETRQPHEFGVAYFWAQRAQGVDGATTIRLKGMCRGMYGSDGGPGWTYGACAGQIRSAELEFSRVVGEAAR